MILHPLARCSRMGVLLRDRTSIGIGGTAERFYTPESVDEMRQVLKHLRAQGLEPFILGGGCNTLFPDRPFSRPILATEKLRGLSVREPRLYVEAGVRLDTLIRVAIESGLSGLEMFIGIPGTVGGAVTMNAGGGPGGGDEFGTLVRTLYCLHPETSELVSMPGSQIEWGYRSARLDGLVVAAAELELAPGDTPALRQLAREFMHRKAAVQPLTSSSAGCIFKNPPGFTAGKLIDEAGLKGERIGGAVVSTRHGNFIINEGGKASSGDILALIERIRDLVWSKFRVRLDLEIVVAEDRPAVSRGGREAAGAEWERRKDALTTHA
ncbi:MAG: UDP-N-acetylmuramate dehydrogenase [Planctomycetes bacterium]|nr:UDP-N-acetylmuramate dehydrogenase [Planctomycetota bacterium]